MLDQAKEQLGLDPALNLEEVRIELRRIMQELHPDRTGGKPATDGQKDRYHLADHHLRLLDSAGKAQGGALRTVQLPAKFVESQQQLITALVEQQAGAAVAEKDRRSRELEERATRSVSAALNRQYRPMRVGAFSLAGLMALLVFLQQQMGTLSAALGEVSPTSKATITLIGSIYAFTFGAMGLYIKYLEDRRAARVQFLLTDLGMRELLTGHAALFSLQMDRDSSLPDIVNSVMLAEAIRKVAQFRDIPASEAAAGAMLDKLQQRGLATELVGPGFAKRYRLLQGLAEEMI